MIEPSSLIDKPNVICQRLKARNISAIAFVDDAYDPFTPEEVSDAQLEAFWATLHGRESANARMLQEFGQFNTAHFNEKISVQSDIDGDVLLKLWEMRETFDALKEPLTQLFATKLDKQEQVDRIASLIKSQCSTGDESVIEIKMLGSGQSIIQELEGTSIVFIDYYLGTAEDQESRKKAIERANEITSEIYTQFGPENLPLVILMSSSPEVKEQQEQFRRDKGWLIGLFYCVTKDDLEDPDKVGINLGTWIERLEQGTKIQQFVDSVEKSLQSALTEFVSSVKNLSLEDYAHVQDFSLAPNGQPLGEYMLWLFNSYLGRLAFENDQDVRKQQDVISGFSFDRLPLNQFTPSEDLIEMYDSALFNKAVGDVTHHPAHTEQGAPSPAGTRREIDVLPSEVDSTEATDKSASTAEAEDLTHGVVISENPATTDIGGANQSGNTDEKNVTPLPYLRLGLIFVKDPSSDIWMVLNPDCDLAYTPDGKRQPTAVVALIAGKMEEMKSKATILKEPKTDLFKWGDNTYLIQWQVKKIAFPEYREVLDHFSKDGYTPYAILRLPYALEVQRAYAAHFTRIGMPVAPPIHHSVNVEILYRDAKGEVASLLVPQPDLAFLTTVRDTAGAEGKMQLKCRFTTHFGHQLKKAVANLGEFYQLQVDALGEGQEAQLRTQLGTKMSRVAKLREKFDELFLTNPSPDLIGKDKGQLVPLYKGKEEIGICRNLGNKDEFNKWGNYLLIVNLLDPDAVDESEKEHAEETI